MTVQQFQELVVGLSIEERLQIAQWLIDSALPVDKQGYTNGEQTTPDGIEPTSSTEKEQQAYRSMHRHLWSQYPKQHIAIYKGQLIDHDEDGIALSRRIYAKYPNQFVLIRKVEPQPEKTLHFRSPRFIHELSEDG